MSAYGILSYGAYIPDGRMSRAAIFEAVGWAQRALKGLAKGERVFSAWDEDPITLAVEASRMALAHSETTPQQLSFASTTAPFLDRQNGGVVAAALDLPAGTHVFDVAGSQRAGTSALMAAAQGPTLIAAADCRPTQSASTMEMLSGDAGAAVLMGTGDVLAEVLGSNSVYADLVDHYRTADTSADYMLEERWYRDEGLTKLGPKAAAPALEAAGLSPGDVTHLIAPVPSPAMAGAVAKSIGIEKSRLADSLFATCGHAGAAHPLLMLAHVLDGAAPGDIILLTAFGQGCDAVVLRVTEAIEERKRGEVTAQISGGVTEEIYTRFLAASGSINIDWGMRAERDNRTAQTVAFDKSRDIYGFVGGLCSACETPQFPKSRRCVNPECSALDTQSDYRFADVRGNVKSFTEDWMAFTRRPPHIYGNVNFDGGGNIFMEMCGFEPGQIAIGSPVQMRFRIKDIDTQRGFHRYFWKAAPIGGENG